MVLEGTPHLHLGNARRAPVEPLPLSGPRPTIWNSRHHGSAHKKTARIESQRTAGRPRAPQVRWVEGRSEPQQRPTRQAPYAGFLQVSRSKRVELRKSQRSPPKGIHFSFRGPTLFHDALRTCRSYSLGLLRSYSYS